MTSTEARTSSENVTSAFLQSFCNYSKSFMVEKCVLTLLELNWNQRLGHRRTKLNICHHMLTSSTQLQNRSFHVVERTTTSSKCRKMKNARAKRAKLLFFIVKYANLWGFCCHRRRGCLSSLIPKKCRLYIVLRIPNFDSVWRLHSKQKSGWSRPVELTWKPIMFT